MKQSLLPVLSSALPTLFAALLACRKNPAESCKGVLESVSLDGLKMFDVLGCR